MSYVPSEAKPSTSRKRSNSSPEAVRLPDEYKKPRSPMSDGVVSDTGIEETPIDGVYLERKPTIRDDRGSIIHFFRSDGGAQFGEIYFSTVRPGAVKAWHLHKVMRLNYLCLFGQVKVVLGDLRAGSVTFGKLAEVTLSGDSEPGRFSDEACILTIPPGIWNGFRSMDHREAMIANFASIPHDPNEIFRCAIENFPLQYDWGDHIVSG